MFEMIAKLQILFWVAREDHDYILCKTLRARLADLGAGVA